ncbi:NADPH-dependent F420 reductase [Mariniluteicoccus flavus]
MKIGIIGSGNIGAGLARLATAADIDVVIANSRGPETLVDLVAELGPRASAGSLAEAAGAGELVVLAVPLGAVQAIPAGLLDGKVVADTSNYYPSRDGRIAALDEERVTEAELVQQSLPGARVVKAFSNILAPHIPALTQPEGADDRTALPVAGDDLGARADVAALVSRLGFDTVDAGTLAEAWRFEPDAAAYTRLYLADPTTPDADMFTAPARRVTPEQLQAALDSATRVRVADRRF